jgi:hypothetical protein
MVIRRWSGLKAAAVYVDDIIVVCPLKMAPMVLDTVLFLLAAFMFPVGSDKSGWSTECTILGAVVCCKNLLTVISIGRDRLDALRKEVEELVLDGRASIRQLQSVTGKLAFITGCTNLWPLLAVVAPVFRLIGCVQQQGGDEFSKRQLSNAVLISLQCIMMLCEGTICASPMLVRAHEKSAIHVYTDAAWRRGCGALAIVIMRVHAEKAPDVKLFWMKISKDHIHERFKRHPIAWVELAASVAALVIGDLTAGDDIQGSAYQRVPVCFHQDNKCAEEAMRKGRSKRTN